MKKPRITVVGSNMVDLISYIERMPKIGETVFAGDFSLGFGGKGANQAVAAALLGAEVTMISRVGDDIFGPMTRKNLDSFGINIEHVTVEAGVSSGVAPIFVDPESNNRILIIKGANDLLLPRHVDNARDIIFQSDMVILQLEIPKDTIYHTVTLCSRNGIPVLFNPAPANTALDITKINTVDFIVPNETELQTLTGLPTETESQVLNAAGELSSRGFRNTIVTLGDRGVLYYTEGFHEFIKAPSVESIDTTGAGDAFIGCFSVYYSLTGDIRVAIDTANKYAALSTTRLGTQKSFPSRTDFDQQFTQ